MARVHSLVARAAPTDANVLVLGENGTGKELVARALHRQSLRADKPMVTVDLGAIATELIDSELFGHVRGAFTDARADRVGRIQAADGGTLFLDEIGNLPLASPAQAADRARAAPGHAGRRQPAGAGRYPRDRRDQPVARRAARPAAVSGRICCSGSTRSRSSCRRLRERREDVPALIDHFLALYARTLWPTGAAT